MSLVLSMPDSSSEISVLTLVGVVTIEASPMHSYSHLPHESMEMLNFDVVLFNSSLSVKLLIMLLFKLLKTLLFKLSLDRVSVVKFLSTLFRVAVF